MSHRHSEAERLSHHEVLAELCGMIGRTVVVTMRAGYIGPFVQISGRLKRATDHDWNYELHPLLEGAGDDTLFFQVVPELSVTAELCPEATGFALTPGTTGRWISDRTLEIEAGDFLFHVASDGGGYEELHDRSERAVKVLAAYLMGEE